MARNIPIRGDLIIIDNVVLEIFIRDLDGDIWVCDNKGTSIKEMIPSRGEDIYNEFDNYGFFQDEIREYIKYESYYTYIPDYLYNFKKLNLTKLARKMYNIADDFKGKVYIAIRRNE